MNVLPTELVVVRVSVEVMVSTLAEAVVVSVYVDMRVVVEPAESVVVKVLMAPSSLVVVVYVEPAELVVRMMIGTTPVKPEPVPLIEVRLVLADESEFDVEPNSEAVVVTVEG